LSGDAVADQLFYGSGHLLCLGTTCFGTGYLEAHLHLAVVQLIAHVGGHLETVQCVDESGFYAAPAIKTARGELVDGAVVVVLADPVYRGITPEPQLPPRR
jgi:hypothetical protein